MRMKGCLCLLCGVALVAAPGCSSRSGLTPSEIDMMIQRCAKVPNQADAEVLVELVDHYEVSADVGSRILEALLKPKVITRDVYPVGSPIGFQLLYPFNIHFGNVILGCNLQTTGDDHSNCSSSWWSNHTNGALFMGGILEVKLSRMEPGTQRIQLHGSWGIDWPEDSGWTADRCKCSFDLPFDVTIVEPEKAPPIELRRNVDLDKAMKSAFKLGKPRRDFGQDGVVYDVPIVASSKLPENICFSTVFRDAGGKEHPLNGSGILRVRAGVFICEHLVRVDELKLPIGKHSGTIILVPEPQAAYADPLMNVIWGGRIELPVEFHVRPKPAGKS